MKNSKRNKKWNSVDSYNDWDLIKYPYPGYRYRVTARLRRLQERRKGL
jgi:hypothetical protein